MATALETLQNSLVDKKKILKDKEDALSRENNDAGLINIYNIKARVDREGYNRECSKKERQRGYQRDWFASDGQKWCGDDSSQAYYNAEKALNQWDNRKNVLSTEIGNLKKEINALEEKIKGYSSTPGGQKELEIIKVKEQAKANVAQAQAQAQAVQIQAQAKIDENKSSTKKTITIIVVVALILALAGGIFWYVKRKKENKK